MNSLKTSGKAVSRLAIAAVVASLFAVPQVLADSMAGGAASTETGGPQSTQSTSSATTENTTRSGGANSGNSTTSSTTQNSSTSSTANVSESGDGPIGQELARQRTVKTTGVTVKSNPPVRRPAIVSSSRSVRTYRKPTHWKSVKYNYRTGSKVEKTVVR